MPTSTNHADQLLVHAAFLRGLAAHLAGGDADDLQQATLAAAMQAPPARGGNERGWLATIAANLWRNELRGRTRRRHHEAQQPTRGPVPTPAEIAAREEVRRRVVTAVTQLPEPLREVVVLRYYEGLDSGAIGRRLQLAPSTVRTRLQQAIGQLRVRLDEEHGGSRAAWAGPMLAWLRAADAPLPVAVPHRAAWTAFAAAATLLMALGAWAWRSADPAPPATGTAVAARDPASAANTEAAATSRVEVAAATTAAGPTAANELRWQPPLGTLHGLVVHQDDGTPVAGAHVAAERLRAPSSPFAPLAHTPAAERRVDTGADGTFDLHGLPVGDYDIDVDGADGLHAWARLAVGESRRDVLFELTPEAGRGQVRVRVLDRSGRGCAAAVTLALPSQRAGCFGWDQRPPLTGRSGADGWFTLRDRPDLAPFGRGFALARTDDGRLGIARLWPAGHTSPTSTTITVDTPGTIVGQLSGLGSYDRVGIIAHPAMTLPFGPECFELRGDVAADGSFRIQGLPPGLFKLQVTGLARRADQEQFWNTMPTEVAAGSVVTSAPAVMQCLPGAVVHGVVRNPAGHAIAGAQVAAVRPWVNGVTDYVLHHREREVARWFRRVHTATAADGTYDLALEPGAWQLIVVAPGWTMDVHLGLRIGDAPRLDLEHTLQADGGIAVHCVDSVQLRRPDAPDEVHALDGPGVCELRGLRPGRWQIGRSENKVFTPITTVDVEAGRTTWVDLARGEEHEHHGLLLHRGQPLADHEVQIGAGLPTRTAADGSFVLRNVDVPGKETYLFVRDHGLLVAQTNQFDGVIELDGRQIELETVAVDGTPLPARIEIGSTFDGNGRRYDVEHSRGNTQLADGRLALLLCGLDAYSAVIATFADGSRTHARIGTQNHLRLVHRPAGAVAVRAIDGNGLPIAGHRVTALSWGRTGSAPAEAFAFAADCADEDEVVAGQTDVQGVAVLRGVPPGQTLVRTWVAGTQTAVARVVDVRAGATATVEVVLGN